MFGKNGNAPKPNASVNNSALEVCNIGLGTTINGTFKADSNIRLEGSIYGSVTCAGRIVMSKNAYIKGDIVCQNIVSEGKVEGDIVAKEKIHLQATAIVEGNLKYATLEIDSGAIFNGQAVSAKSNSAPKLEK
ncbi:bactofilin family protein [Aureispira anguillae]|nr:polymer-forming cytoskeletal protein [Aureispira anguillae]